VTKANPLPAHTPVPQTSESRGSESRGSESRGSENLLGKLIRLFYADPAELGQFKNCDEASVPAPYRALLAHDAHMTVTVERRHGCPVSVEVLESHENQTHYVRKILLRRTSDNRVVQFGIVRLKLAAIDAEPRAEILAKQIPLGRALIQHNVMRHVELLDVWSIECGRALAEHFVVEKGHATFGRTALIYCNAESAIELLEIVAPEDTFGGRG
jgi:chorismate-pyruvate lyase